MIVDFTTLQRPRTPNRYLLCPPAFCQTTPNKASPVFDLPFLDLVDAWERIISRQKRLTTLDVNRKLYQFNYEQRTRLFRFPDRITVQFMALSQNESTLAIYSRSKYGYFDFGTNRRRVKRWLKALTHEINKGLQTP